MWYGDETVLESKGFVYGSWDIDYKTSTYSKLDNFPF